jgi:NAD(P)-dependent dehydrogenase (short-subunit alcohol dehydrogenase family)
MTPRAEVVGSGQLADAAIKELADRGFAVGPGLTEDLQVVVFTEVIGAERTLAAIRERQDRLSTSGHGRVVIVGGRDWLGWPHRAARSAELAALVGLTRSLALELGPAGITVNLVCPPDPGIDDSDVSDDPWISPPPPLTGQVDDIDIAFAIGFAADEASDYFTGQVVHVSGGLSVLSSLTA